MRKVAFTALLSIFLFSAALLTASATSLKSSSGSVSATADSSGVSIIINQSSTSHDGDTSGNISITVSSASTDQTLVCTLKHEGGIVDVQSLDIIDVTWSMDTGANLTFVVPSIRMAGILSNFTCEQAD